MKTDSFDFSEYFKTPIDKIENVIYDNDIS